MNIRPYNPNSKQEFKAGDYAIEQMGDYFWSGMWMDETKFNFWNCKFKPTGKIIFYKFQRFDSIEKARKHIEAMQKHDTSVKSKPIYHKP